MSVCFDGVKHLWLKAIDGVFRRFSMNVEQGFKGVFGGEFVCGFRIHFRRNFVSLLMKYGVVYIGQLEGEVKSGAPK